MIGSTKEESDLSALKREVQALAAMYECAKDVEVEWHGVVPPDEFADIHEMVYGWTIPIRNGVSSFLEVLETLANIDRRALKKGTASVPSFNIVFEAPENIDEFSRRLNRYHAQGGRTGEAESGSRGCLAPSPHNTLHAEPHRAFHSVVKLDPSIAQ